MDPISRGTEATSQLWWPVGAMFGAQSVAVLVFLTVPIMATEIAPDFGVAAKDIGIYMSIVFASAMVFSAASGSLIHRFGGIRAIQLGLGFSATCLLLATAGSLPLLYLSAVLVGVGYGPNTPSGAHVLARVTPPKARGFVFSLKQSGAPLGGLVAGLLVPGLVTVIGWRAAIVVSVAIAFATIVALQSLRPSLDDDRDVNTRLKFASPWQAIRKILSHPPLRRLTLVAFCLTSIQAIVMAFLIIILVEELALAYPLAGAIFAASQAFGAGLRIAMGWIADRTLGTRATLIGIGILSPVALIALTFLNPASPIMLIVGISVLAGALSFGWNGVFLAEIVNRAAKTDVGTATGGSLFFLYAGVVIGPILMSGLITLSGGYGAPLVSIAIVTIAASLNLMRTAA